MERKVIIISNKTQSQHVIENSRANTLGELKAELSNIGVDYHGMSFYEGHARVELKDDASVLPTNIPYKGQIINDLTFLLSAPEKKIKSGLVSRKEVFEEIKRQSLQGKVIEKFGRNMTQVSTSDLLKLLDKDTVMEEKKVSPIPGKENVKDADETSKTYNGDIKRALRALVNVLEEWGHISGIEALGILALLEGKEWEQPNNAMSNREINEMFDFVS